LAVDTKRVVGSLEVELMHLESTRFVDKIESASLRDDWLKVAVCYPRWIKRRCKGNKNDDLKLKGC
jgi:hypothetical protein